MTRCDPGRPEALLVVHCGQRRFGVPVAAIRKVVAAPRPWPLPDAPAIVAGVVNLHGTPLVVLDPARRGAAASADMTLASRIVIISTQARPYGLLCDSVGTVLATAETQAQPLDALLPDSGLVAVLRGPDGGMIVLRDPESWLAGRDARMLDDALAHLAPTGLAPAMAEAPP